MSAVTYESAAAAGATTGAPSQRKLPKTELWIVWWTMPLFYQVFVIAFFMLAKTQPFPPPHWGAEEVLAWFHSHPSELQIGNLLWFLTLGIPAWHIGLIAVVIRHMSVSPAFAYAYLGIMCVATLPGGLMFALGYALIALRPDRDPVAIEFLYDFANLTFAGSMGVFFAGSLILVIAILLDKNKILPKWFGYASIWNLTTEFTVAPVWIFKDGPMAWNGEVSFYWNMVIYGVWQVMYIYVFFRAIQKLPPKTQAFAKAPGRAAGAARLAEA